jgi:O-antigen ligase
MFSTITFRVYSTLENPNVLGEYFLLVIPFAAALLLTADSWKKRGLWLAACGILTVCLVVTYSRGCYLGLLFAAAIFLVLLDRRFLILGIVAVVLSPLYLPESVLTRFTSIGDMADSSTSFRVYIWMGTLAMLKDYWFCGVGPGTEAFNLVYPNYAYSAIEAPHSHNLYLQILCDTGVVGLGLFLVLVVSGYRMLFTAIRRETDRNRKIFQIAGVSALSGFLLQSMTDYTFYNYRVMFLFWAVLGLCGALCRRSADD